MPMLMPLAMLVPVNSCSLSGEPRDIPVTSCASRLPVLATPLLPCTHLLSDWLIECLNV